MGFLHKDICKSHFYAYHITENLKLKEVARLFDMPACQQSVDRLIYQDNKNSYFFIYKFGAIIFFDVNPEQQREIIARVRTLVDEQITTIISEEFLVEIGDKLPVSVSFESVTLDSNRIDRLELIAFILGQSTALEYFEDKVDDMFCQIADIGHDLKANGRLHRSAKDLKIFIGQCIIAKTQLIASLYILDKPDETWDDPILDCLYRDLSIALELRDRYRSLDYKLRMIQENLELISDLLYNRHATFLEWAIVILIAIEIALFVFELFFQS